MKQDGSKLPHYSCPQARWAALTLLLAALVGAAPARAAEAPVTARLDLLTPPALGGVARVIWAAIPDAAPQRAELTLTIAPPGGARPRRITRSLALARGQVCEQEFPVHTDIPGAWNLQARLRMPLNGQVLTQESGLTFNVPQSRPAKPLGADDAITTVAVGGPAAGVAVPYAGAAWLRFDAVTTGSYRIDLTTQSMAWNMVFDLYGPNRIDQPVNQFWLGLDLKKPYFSVALRPGAYYLKLWCLDKTAGEFKVGVTRLGLRDGTPVIQKFAINNGATSTTQRRLTLNNACSGAPAELWVSAFPSFVQGQYYEDADLELRQWFPYSQKPYFGGRGNGLERIYFRVRTADGFYSQAASDAIEIVTIDRLPENAPPLTGVLDHPGEWDWWRFSTPSERYFQLVTDDRNKIQLFGPDSMTLLAADQMNAQRDGYSSLIARLKPGTYYARVQMAESRPGSYQVRLLKSMGPIIAGVTLNNARGTHPVLDGRTFERTILLKNQALGDAAQYMLTTKRLKGGRAPDFTDAMWKPYAPEIRLTLPAGATDKSIFFKVRNYKGKESPVVRTGIALRESAPLPIGEKRPGLVEARDEFTKAHAFEVTREGDYFIDLWNGADEAPVDALFSLDLYGPDAKLIKNEGLVFQRSDEFSKRFGVRLKPGVYYLLADVDYLESNGWWYGGKYSIRVSRYTGAPQVLDFNLSSAFPSTDEYTHRGFGETFRRMVTLNTLAFGAPVSIMASESPSFKGASWQPYATTSTFSLSLGRGVKTVYLKTRNSQGRESNVISDSIFYNMPRLLMINDPPASIQRYDAFNYHKFNVTEKGYYTVNLQPASGPNEASPQTMQAKLLTFDGAWITNLRCYGQTRLELKPGSYLIQTDKGDKDEYGEWSDTGYYKVRVFESQ